MLYDTPTDLIAKAGNNLFAWEVRNRKYGKSPTLTIASVKTGNIDDLRVGEDIVFEEVEDDKLRSCVGLESLIRMVPIGAIPEMIVFDNHNHALYFWIEAAKRGIIEPGFELVHIDEHSDLWDNENTLDLERAMTSEEYAWDFTHLSCNVGNYILPAIDSGLVGNMIRIENEYQIDEYMHYIPSANSVLNLDLDIFAPELDHIPEEKKIEVIRNLMKRIRYITVATSPFFIEQERALAMLRKIRD